MVQCRVRLMRKSSQECLLPGLELPGKACIEAVACFMPGSLQPVVQANGKIAVFRLDAQSACIAYSVHNARAHVVRGIDAGPAYL